MSTTQLTWLPQISPVRGESFLDTYANQVRLGTTISDFTIIFGVSDDRGPAGVHLKDVVAIHLAPGTMKLLLGNLKSTVEAYEASIGTIPLPANTESQLEEQTRRISEALHAMMSGRPPTQE
jgi:hypothetical protein